MLELVPTQASVVGCFAAPEALDALIGIDGAYAGRVAPDEMMLVGEAGLAEGLVGAATARASAADPDAVVLDTSDGWAVWTLEGDTAREAFARLSAVPLQAEYTQGDVAHVPVRAIALADRVHLLVPAMWREHLRARILADCTSLDVREVAEATVWSAPARGGLAG